MSKEINATSISPKSYHSSQTESIAQTNSHGSSEQTIHTETCRITETTMRMEHKSPLPDIEFKPSPRLFESKERHDIQAKHLIENVSIPSQFPNIQSGHDHSVATKTFEKSKYTALETPVPKEVQTIANNTNFIHEKPNYDSDFGSKSKYSSVSKHIKTLEQSDNQSVYKPTSKWYAPTDSPIAEFGAEPNKVNGTSTPNPINETIGKFSRKMQEYEENHWSRSCDLKAPALVKHVTPIVNGDQSKEQVISHMDLEPGDAPEFCFAPRSTHEKKSSFVERIEKSLERELEKGPSKVLPYTVRTMPPLPRTVSIEAFETTKRSIVRQPKQPETYEQKKDSNHFKHTFYEHNKPLQTNIFDQFTVPRPKAPEKVRSECVCVQFINVLKTPNQNQVNNNVPNNFYSLLP